MIYEFTPTQDLHGYDSPWPAGGGKNLYNSDNFIFNESPTITTKNGITLKRDNGKLVIFGTATAETRFDTGYAGTFKSGKTYTISVRGLSNGTIRVVINGNPTGHGLSYKSELPTSDFFYTFTVDADVVFQYFFLDVQNGATINNVVSIQIEEGSTATAWTPYSNICPPEGFNIWDPTNAEYVQVYAGYVNANTRELYLRPVYKEYDGEELVGPWMSSLDPYEEDTTPTEGAFVIDFGGELESFEITPFMLQTLLDSLGIRQHFTDGAGLLNKLMDQAQGRVRSEEELLHLSRPLQVIAIGDQLPSGITFKPISKDVLPGLPGKFIR